ncbi:MAG: hypothetical protein ACAH11_09980, partial [Sphingomonas sp.]
TSEAERTHCQAIARVIYGDLRGQKAMIDSLKGQPTKTEADEARITRLESAYAADSQLFEALRARYSTAATPTPEAMKALRNTSYNEIKRQAQVCLGN